MSRRARSPCSGAHGFSRFGSRGPPWHSRSSSTTDEDAEITEVYVRRDHRGCGLGTKVTRGAIAAAVPLRDLWIGADDEDRAKLLYARLGFRPVATSMQFLRLPG